MNTSTRAVVTLHGLHKPAADWVEFHANNHVDVCGFDDDLAKEIRDLAECGLAFNAALVDGCVITRKLFDENSVNIDLHVADIPVQGLVLLLCHYLKHFEPNGYIAFEFELDVGGFVVITQAVVVSQEGPIWYPNPHSWIADQSPRGKTKINS